MDALLLGPKESTAHMQGPDGMYYVKFITPEGGEFVFDLNTGKPVLDEFNVGTNNDVVIDGDRIKGIKHIFADVIDWVILGTKPESDKSLKGIRQRIEALTKKFSLEKLEAIKAYRKEYWEKNCAKLK
jgi:hypothetical protein